jgi:ribonuclease T2
MASRVSQAVFASLLFVPATLALSFASATCSDPQTSCQNTTVVTDLCCFNAPGGQFLQTQFWDTDPATGPSNSWTIHGLWPDNCDGTYSESCDSSRDYTDITSILTSFGKTSTLDYMNTYWLSDDESNEAFWEHEWSTHGTCVNTLDPSCYTDYSTGEEAADFFEIVVNLFQTLDTYGVLSDAGITPSNSKTYTSAEIQDAIKASFGYEVTLECSDDTLDAMEYTFYVTGSLQTGTFVPASPVGQSGTCPSSGIKYPVKSGSAVTTTATTATTTTKTSTQTSTTATATATGTFSGKGYLNAYESDGTEDGCLISAGTWYTTGTCATYTAAVSGSGFTLTTSKGACEVSDGTLTCASGNSATIFNAINGYLAYDDSIDFYTDAVPTGSTQATISTSSGSVTVNFEWEAT